MSNLVAEEFKAPSSHPDYERADTNNVFTVLPVSRVVSTQPGDTLAINLATYVDPFAESWVHSAVAKKPRWLQGVELEVSDIELIDELVEPHQTVRNRSRHHRDFNPGAHYPADRAFKGSIALRGVETDAYGVMHPAIGGWVKLDAEGEPMRTIADLKRRVGKISATQAKIQTDGFYKDARFRLPGVSSVEDSSHGWLTARTYTMYRAFS